MSDRVIVQNREPGCLIWFVLLFVGLKACDADDRAREAHRWLALADERAVALEARVDALEAQTEPTRAPAEGPQP